MHVARNGRGACLSLLAALVALVSGRTALAAVDCATLPSPVYGLGANSVKPLVSKVAAALAAANPPLTVVYQGPGQCVGLNALLGPVNMTGTATYWDATGQEKSCNLPALDGQPVEIAYMNSYATLCPGVAALPPDVGDFLGPVQSFDFIVPKASSQTVISAAAAYFVYGFGAAGQAEPWIDENRIFKRDPNSGAALFIALASGVPAEKLKGIDAKSNGNTITLVSTAPNPESAIGIVSGEVAEANQNVISTLAYQHYGQSCGYWPSTTASSFDKRNIRDGHYFIWSPTHFFTRVDAQGKPTSAGAEKLIGYITGTLAPPAGVDVLELEIEAGTVPDCAMEVRRESDLGPIESYAPKEPCGCYFDSVATGNTTCAKCATNDDCGPNAPNCRYGFCEVN
jgi:ABC-type phosphate transport system substrate-binding protein